MRGSYGNSFWKACMDVLKTARELTLPDLVDRIVTVVNYFESDLNESINQSRSKLKNPVQRNLDLLRFVKHVNSRMFVIGSTGDDFYAIVEKSTQSTPAGVYEAWIRISQLIVELISFASNEICPQCNSDHLRIMTDLNQEKLFKYCASCMSTISQDGSTFGNNVLVPARIEFLRRNGYL